MVLTISLLTKKNASFAIIWKLATTSESRLGKIGKHKLIEHNVQETCETIISIMNGNANAVDKCSLYLLSQLMYGTMIVFSKQVTFLRDDLISLLARIKRHTIEIINENQEIMTKKGIRRKMKGEDDGRSARKRSKTVEDEDFDLFSTNDVALAAAHTITISDDLPLLPTPGKIFEIEDDLMPIPDDFNDYVSMELSTFYDYQSSSNANKQNEVIRNADTFLDEPITPTPPRRSQSPLFDMDVDMNMFHAPGEDDIRLSQTTPKKIYSNESLTPAPGLIDILARGIEEPRNGRSSIDFDDEVGGMLARSLSDNPSNGIQELDPFVAPPPEQQYRAEPYSFELDALDRSKIVLEKTPMKTPMKPRRAERGRTQIPHSEMREMESDYTSLLHENARSVHARIRSKNELTLNELLDFSPYYYRGKRFAPHLRYMYELSDEARNYQNEHRDIGTTVPDESEKDSENNTSETREKVYEDIELENLQFLSTPMKFNMTPPHNSFSKALDFELPRASPLQVQPMNQDFEITMNTNPILNNTTLTDEMIVGKSPNMTRLLESPRFESREKNINEITPLQFRERIIRECETQAPFFGKMDKIVSANDGCRNAARAFYVVLVMAKEQQVTVKDQEKPFDVIEFQLNSAESEDLEELVSSEADADKGFINSRSSKSSKSSKSK